MFKSLIYFMRSIIFFSVLFFLFSCNETEKKKNKSDVYDDFKDKVDPVDKTINWEERWAIYKDSLRKVEHIFNEVDSFTKNHAHKFDSVLFTFEIKGKRKYIVSKGDKSDLLFGVVNQEGQIEIPCVYEKIYNPNAVCKDVYEVVFKGENGLLKLNGDYLLLPEYDVIYPGFGDKIACFKKGSKFGYLTKDSIAVFVKKEELSDFLEGLFNQESLDKWSLDYKNYHYCPIKTQKNPIDTATA